MDSNDPSEVLFIPRLIFQLFCKSFKSKNSLLCVVKYFNVIQVLDVTGQRPAPERVCLGPAVVCGFLTSWRKDCTTQVPVTMRIHLLKLQTVKQGGAQHRRSNSRAQAGLPQFSGKPEKRGLWGQVQGISLGQLPATYCLKVQEMGACEERSGGEIGEREWCWLLCRGSFVLSLFSLSLFSLSLSQNLRGGLRGGFQQNIHQFSRRALPGSWSPLIGSVTGQRSLVTAVGSSITHLVLLVLWARS